jgi:hypothetical protein
LVELQYSVGAFQQIIPCRWIEREKSTGRGVHISIESLGRTVQIKIVQGHNASFRIVEGTQTNLSSAQVSSRYCLICPWEMELGI